MNKTNWNELIGKNVLVYMSNRDAMPITRKVTGYINGKVKFDNIRVWYPEYDLRLHSVIANNNKNKSDFGLAWD